jgi:DNA end-binding protein Ku
MAGMKPRSLWTGHLKLELLTIPVRLYAALNEAEKVSFNQLHKGCHQRLRQHLDCPVHGKVERDAVVKGFELEKDRYVVLEAGDLEAVKLESTRTIELVRFVSPREIDPALWDTPYFLGPDGPVAEPALAVLREAMRRRRRVGLGQVTMHGREHLVALRPQGKGCVLTTLRYAAEVRSAAEVFGHLNGCPMNPGQLRLATQLVDNLAARFDPSAFVDRYQAAVRELIEAKLKGTPLVQVLPSVTAPVVNLSEALERSVARTAPAVQATEPVAA